MCKKSLLMMLLLALFAPWAANAQTSLFSEDFEGGTMPAGWTTDGSGSWSVGVGDYSTSTGAGHGSYNAKITHGSTGNVTKLITPEIDLSTVASAELSFMHVQRSWAGDIDQLRVYYRTSSSGSWTQIAEYTAAFASWTTEDGIVLPNLSSTYQIAFEHTDSYGYGVGVDNIVIVQGASCPKPTGLNFALTPGDGTVATLSWTSEATAWQICLNGDETNLIAATTNPWQLTGLTPETTYTAKVRANCGSEQSDWSNEVTFTPTNAYALTVNDGTSTNGLVPIYGTWVDNITKSQFIIPAENLADMAWGTINKMTFYANADKNWGAAQFEVYMTETSETTLSELADYSTMTKVKNAGSLSISGNVMEVILDAPYQYTGGNLMIGFLQTVSGSWSGCSWYGVSAEGASMGGYGSSINQQNFLPKTTFDYVPGEEPACMWPTNLAVSNVTAHTAELSWTSDGTAWQIGYSTDGFVTEQYVEVTENPYTLTGLDPETDYEVRVQKNCGGGTYSVFCTPVAFTTEVACPAPTDLVISDITAYSANVNWSPSEGTFEFRYSPDVRPITNFDDSQMHNWTNIDADGDGYVWVLGSEAAGVYHNDGTDVTGQGYNSSHDFIISGSWSNYAGVALTPDNYFVSPQITLGGSISFWACAQDVNFPAEHFGVAVSTTGNTDAADFTTIQEWTMTAKSAGTLRSSNGKRGGDNLRAGNWYQYTVDLSAYSGQGYVAIRHFGCTDQFLLNVDDIYIEQPGFELPWIYPTTLPALTNLDPETTYIVQVRANCGDEGYSAWLEGTFTTLPACMVPTNLVISNIDKRSADLAWTANGEETAWQIEISDSQNPPVVTVYDVTTTSFTLPGLQPETRYTVRVRAVCDEELQSAWSSPVTFTTLIACPAPTALAISNITNVSAVATWTYDGDVELEYAEDVWKYYDNGTFGTSMGAGGTIYWGILLTPDMLPANQPLTHIAMYENENNANPTTISIYSGGDAAPGTFLYSEEVTPVGNGFHEIALAEPVEFDATQNLWIVCYNDADTYPAAGSANLTNPNGRWVSLDGEEWADINGYGYNYTWMIRAAFGNNTQTEWIAVNNPASPQTLAGLTPETNYLVRLRAVCGGEDGESVWVTTSFTTDIACPAPTALAAEPYANSAVLSWEGISESYTVSYREPAVIGGIDEEFATSSAPTGWTRSNTLLTDDVLNGTTALATYNGGWNFGTSNGVFDSHARVNIYGTSCKYWLVTPAIEVPTGAEFSFDLALTAYSGTVAAPATTGTDDKFVVLVSTDNMATWTILRQWDNAGSEYVYNNIANTATGEQVSFDFSAYAGQTVNIAFYGESTESNADNNLHIDNVNVTVAELVPAGEWMTVDADEAAVTITGLTAETKYEWKVQGDCGDFGMSEESAIETFTTTNDLCPVPTNLTVNNETITATTADLSWEGSPDVESFTVRYRIPEHASGGLYEPFNSNSIPAGWTRYSGLVNDVIAGTATLTTTTSGWYTTEYALGTYNMKVNIYGTSAKYWLVTPEVTLSSGNFSFDLALTDYNNSDPIEDATAQADDRFVVLVYANDAWTILREWNNTGSDYVYNTIATEGEAVSIDLSAYVGQTVKIAFYGESTASGGDNDLHIDNVVFGELVPATDWMTAEGITDMNVTLTGLTPETPYEAQVKADCSDPEAWSNTVNFTTLEQTIVTQTIALSAGWNWVSFNVEITLADLEGALEAAYPSAANNALVVKAKVGGQTAYNPMAHRWIGGLQSIGLDLSQMYLVKVPTEGEITLEGMPINPEDYPATIAPGVNWIAFPLSESMTIAEAFAGFPTNQDIVKAKTGGQAQWNSAARRWIGGLANTPLQPGQGYIYNSKASETRTFTFPTPAK